MALQLMALKTMTLQTVDSCDQREEQEAVQACPYVIKKDVPVNGLHGSSKFTIPKNVSWLASERCIYVIYGHTLLTG